jgi:hypothetical protein
MREQRRGELERGGRRAVELAARRAQWWRESAARVAFIGGLRRARPVAQPSTFSAGDCGCAATCGHRGAGNVESARNEAAKPARTAAAAWGKWERGGGRHGVVQAAACGRVAGPACRACVA